MKKIFTTVFIIFFYFLPKNVQSEIKPIIEGNIDYNITEFYSNYYNLKMN